ncbi:MAG: class I SAM-dependent methyltransferase [Methanolobus sp.]
MEKFLLLEIKSCELCDSNDFQLIYEWPPEYYSHKKFETCSWDGREEITLNIVKCNHCGLVQSRPSFKEEYLHKVYPEDIVPVNVNIETVFGMRHRKYKSLLNIISRHISEGTLIDVGSRYGVFPWMANKLYGYNSYGLEYNSEAVKLGKQKFGNLHQGTVDDLPKFIAEHGIINTEIIVLDDVLEHLVHPARDIQKISQIQRKGNFLFLRQMDYDSFGRKLFRKNWYYFQPAAHQFYFNEKSIKDLLNNNDYEIVKIYRPNLITNIFMTPVEMIYMKIRRFLENNKKDLYLTKRLKMYDDMFLVVAQKSK